MQCNAVVIVLNRKVKFDWNLRQRIILFLCQKTVFYHVLKYGVAAFQRVFGVEFRVVGRCRFQKTDKNSIFFNFQIFRQFVEICFCGGFYSESVAADVHRIEIHYENFLF